MSALDDLIDADAVLAQELQDAADDAVETSGDEADGAYLRELVDNWESRFAVFDAWISDGIRDEEPEDQNVGNGSERMSDDILTSTAPERIWLIVDPDDLDQQYESWPGDDGVTWCADAVGGATVEYVRADLANRALEEARLFHRLPAVETKTGLKRSTIYARIRAGLFPGPIAISERTVAWISDEISAVQAAVIRGASEAELRSLVSQLHEARGYQPDPAKQARYRAIVESRRQRKAASRAQAAA